MIKKLFIPVLLICSVLLVNCGKQEYETHKKPVFNSILEAPPAEMEAVLKRTYRLEPDRRFGMAIQELRKMFSLEEQTLEYFFREGSWHVFADKMKICTLDEFPTFQQLLDVLIRLTKRYHNKYPLDLAEAGTPSDLNVFEHTPKDFYPIHLSRFIRQLDQRWQGGHRHPDYLPKAAEAYALLGLQSFDYLELTDRLMGRTLALLAMSKGLTAGDMNRVEAMVAFQMGYEGHCLRILKQTPGTSPFALFFLRKDGQLEKLAVKEPDLLTRYLWLLRFAEGKEVEEWEQLRRELFSGESLSLLPAIKTGLEMNRFDTNRSLSRALPYVVLDSVGFEVDDPVFSGQIRSSGEAGLAAAADLFERGIGMLATKPRGFFSSPEAITSFYRGFFYSALYKLGLHLLDELASVQSGMFYLDELGKEGAPLLVEFKDWYSLLLKFRHQRTDVKVLLDRLDAPGQLRGRLLRRFSQDAVLLISPRSSRLTEVVRLMVGKMDSRLSNRHLLGRVSLRYLQDIDLMERILKGSTGENCALSLLHSIYGRDKEGLLKIIRLPYPPRHVKVQAIRELGGFGDTRPLFIQYEFNKLMAKYPDDWRVVEEFAGYLKNSAKFRQAAEVVSGWVRRHDRSRGFDYINARKELARLYYLDENYNKGLDAIEEVATSWQAGVLETKALLLSRLGKRAAAEELAAKVIERYPSSVRSRAVLAELHWRHGNFQAACDAIKGYPRRYVANDWHDHIAVSFLRGLEGQTLEKGVEAFKVLVDAGFSAGFLHAVPYKCFRAGKSRWAFRLQTQLKLTGIGQLNLLITAYQYGKEFMEEGEALKWLKRNTPAYLYSSLSLIAFGLDEYELPWKWPRPIKSKQRLVYDWLMKAACARVSGGEEHPHWPDLVAYYSEEGISHYHHLGRFLVGLAPEEELYKLMDMPGRKCEIAFFIGLKYEASGDLYKASQWYRICLETGLERNLEYVWAYERLNRWAQNKLFLRLIG